MTDSFSPRGQRNEASLSHVWPLGLIHEFDVRITVGPTEEIGDGPLGRRQYFEVTSATVVGERLSGALIGSAGDWLLAGSDGYARMDVRMQVRTGDGAVLGVHYFGPAETNERTRQAMAASEATSFADQRIRTHWQLETGNSRYAWVNRAVFVGEGRLLPNDDGSPGFEHRVYRIDRPAMPK